VSPGADPHAAIALCQLEAYSGKFGSTDIVFAGTGYYYKAVPGALAAVRKYLSVELLWVPSLRQQAASCGPPQAMPYAC
jgi:hypothetical protein